MIDLATIVDPLPVERFLDAHWPSTPYWSNDGGRRLTALLEIEQLQSAEKAFEGASRVRFFKPDGGIGTVAGDKAMAVYRLGLTCTLGCAHIPALTDAAERLAGDLGMPAGSLTCEIFCSNGDSGVAMHSDHDINFAVLLSGAKRWQLAENRHIRNQTNVCRPGSHPEQDAIQVQLADQLPFPEEMPADAHTLEFEAGGLLFMPRGWWHQTKSRGECLQVNFVVNKPVWMGVLIAGLERRLISDPDWREYAFDLFGPAERREVAIAKFASLLEGLTEVLDADDPLALATELIEDTGLRPAQR